MLAIRMRRLGAKKRPFFRVVVIDSHAARDGRALEVLGHYNPTTVPETFQLNHERLDHWLTRGARPSDTLRTLITRHPPGEAAAEAATPPAASAPAASVSSPPAPAPAAEPAESAGAAEAVETAVAAGESDESATEEAPAETPSAEEPKES